MDEPRQVELVRVPREEEFYDREQVLGRDVSSVFPNQAAEQGVDALDAIKEAIGAKKFISETELEAIKASRGLSVDDGTMAADKPLAELLRERKEAKEAEFQDKWKSMKQGKNRPLDEDELAFLDTLYEQERQQLQQQAAEEAEALDAYRAAVALARGEGSTGEGPAAAAAAEGDDGGFDALEAAAAVAGPGAGPVASSSGRQQVAAAKGAAGSSKGWGRGLGSGSSNSTGVKRPALPALVKVRPKAAGNQQQQQQAAVVGQEHKRLRLTDRQQGPVPAAAGAAAAPEQAAEEDSNPGEGLAGLLGYSSDQDDSE